MSEYEQKPVQLKAAPTAGPAQDDRYGAGKVGADMKARIISVSVVGGHTQITIAQGTTHGAHAGMAGYITKPGGGMLADFQIHEAREAMSFATVHEVTPDELQGVPTAVINPTSRPHKTIKTAESSHVIGVQAEDGKSRITIALGSAGGVTHGMRGSLQGNQGEPGPSFVIDRVMTNRSSAIVDVPTAQVQARSHVVLQPNRSSGTVQRRANGASSTADVNATAQAGVAGASSRLPHFDAIQRSFGKHDISNIQAQVGGAATDASQALGAQAYATGNKVAFASAPDLHTAAHEAAHTIQQARGAVGFQGLGAADDEHERHADAVADAVVAGQSAEPLLDQIGGGGSAGAIQRKPRADERTASKLKALQEAREVAAFIEKHTSVVPAQIAALQEARESADPARMRGAAGRAMTTRGLLMSASDTLRSRLDSAAPVERARFEKLLGEATSKIAMLEGLPERARQQAEKLDHVANGAFAEVPKDNVPRTPEETRQRAAKVAPLGLCDDPTMQSPHSRACPIDPTQRDALRETVRVSVGAIATNWREAAADAQLDYRLRPLFEKSGMNPILTLLLGAGFSWLGGIALGFLRQKQAIAAAETLEQVAEASIMKAAPSSEDKMLLGIHKKLVNELTKPDKVKAQKGTALIAAMRHVEQQWEMIAMADIRQLPDPVLVALGESLQQSPYTVAFFTDKLTALVDNYDEIGKVGQVTLLERQALVAVKVRHPSGPMRYALARPSVRVVDNAAPGKGGREPGDDQIEVRDGNYIFHKWVDRSLAPIIADQAKLVLASNDSRWRDAKGRQTLAADLSQWHADPSHTDDVNMLALPKNPFVPKAAK